jgi:hypothetical protein
MPHNLLVVDMLDIKNGVLFFAKDISAIAQAPTGCGDIAWRFGK